MQLGQDHNWAGSATPGVAFCTPSLVVCILLAWCERVFVVFFFRVPSRLNAPGIDTLTKKTPILRRGHPEEIFMLVLMLYSLINRWYELNN